MFLAVLGAIVAGLYSYFHFAAIQLNKEWIKNNPI
jgi:hypothetical protein